MQCASETLSLDKYQLNELISPTMKLVNAGLETITMKTLTEPGQNYGSVLLRIDIILKSGKPLYLVGKVWPPTKFLRDFFTSSETFCKEINMYKLVAPALLQLQLEKGFSEGDIYELPKYYGSRINKEDNDNLVADENSVLLLENLEMSGYRIMDRMVGLDLIHSKMALRKLAQLQALAIGLKMCKPQIFNETVMKACKFYKIQAEDIGKEEAIDQFLEYFKNIPECLPFYEKMRECCLVGMMLRAKPPVPKEPYATIVHNDFWVNNMMFSYENGCVNDCKIIDFQGTSYDSPARDIILFLYTSTAEGVRKRHFDELLQEYYNTFVQCLSKLGCDTKQFSSSSFIRDINGHAPFTVFLLLYILGVVYAEHKPDDITQINDLSFFDKGRGPTYKARAVEMLLEFNEKGWLDLDSSFL